MGPLQARLARMPQVGLVALQVSSIVLQARAVTGVCNSPWREVEGKAQALLLCSVLPEVFTSGLVD